MTRKAHDALKASIRHWKRMAAGKRRDREQPVSDDCALCEAYPIGQGCVGCPVKAFTGLSHCEETPYRAAYDAWREIGIGSETFKAAARKEIEFLESLLPKRKKK